jgi:hypothetical protein
MPQLEAPCRLFVYLARSAPLGVVLRRGPSDWVQLSLWHTDTDSVEHGGWFKGRVYERRCDLSADGALFVYFARKSSGRRATGPDRDSWLALSRPPWFTALALWWVGGTYHTGGCFTAAGSLFLGGTDRPDQGVLPAWLVPAAEIDYIDRSPEWTERTVLYNRLLRDGWQPLPDISNPAISWEKRDPSGRMTLMMTQATAPKFRVYGGPYVVTYGVRTESGGEVQPLGRATWADWDQRGRLVLAQDGRLLHRQASGALRELADFAEQRPVPVASPPWAHAWPERSAPGQRSRPHG